MKPCGADPIDELAHRTDKLSFHITAVLKMARFNVIFTFVGLFLCQVGGHVAAGKEYCARLTDIVCVIHGSIQMESKNVLVSSC